VNAYVEKGGAMTKFFLSLTLICLGILFIGGLALPASPAFWWASNSGNFAVLRLLLAVIVGVLLVTEPPRNLYFRLFVGVMSTGLITWSIIGTYENHMLFLDTLSLLATGIACYITALERHYSLDVQMASEEP
jgi:MFS-type transporter involved in bile tolerance (Atg22 family)